MACMAGITMSAPKIINAIQALLIIYFSLEIVFIIGVSWSAASSPFYSKVDAV
jgi:hypothetical protein